LFKDYDQNDLKDVIEKTKLTNLVEKLPQGLKTKTGERGESLSGGEAQRIGIARSLIVKPKIILMDEITANLDNEISYEIEKSVINLANVTKIFTTHKYRESILNKCDGIIVLDDGKIVEEGTFDELMNKNGYFFKLYNNL